MNREDAMIQMAREQERLERELVMRDKVMDYLIHEVDDEDEVDINELYRSFEEEAEYNYQRAEENSLRNAWQQDLIDLYRYER